MKNETPETIEDDLSSWEKYDIDFSTCQELREGTDQPVLRVGNDTYVEIGYGIYLIERFVEEFENKFEEVKLQEDLEEDIEECAYKLIEEIIAQELDDISKCGKSRYADKQVNKYHKVDISLPADIISNFENNQAKVKMHIRSSDKLSEESPGVFSAYEVCVH